MKRLTILVTGTRGVLGEEVVAALEIEGHQVVRHAGRESGDLTDAIVANDVVSGSHPDVVVHAAGRTYGTPAELWAANVLTAVRLGDAMRSTCPDSRLVLMSSAAVYGLSDAPRASFREQDPCAPNSDYGYAKLAMERLLPILHPATVIARVFNIIGAHADARALLPRVHAAYEAGDPSPQGSSDVRDWVTAHDVARALAALATVPDVPPVVNVCSGIGRTPAQVLGRDTDAPPHGWSVGDPTLLQQAIGLRPDSA